MSAFPARYKLAREREGDLPLESESESGSTIKEAVTGSPSPQTHTPLSLSLYRKFFIFSLLAFWIWSLGTSAAFEKGFGDQPSLHKQNVFLWLQIGLCLNCNIYIYI